MTYVKAVGAKGTERNDQPSSIENLQRTRIATRTNRERERNQRYNYMTDTHNETQSETTDFETWTDVSRKRRRGRIKTRNQMQERTATRRNAPTTAAITLRKEGDISNAQLLKLAREKIALKDLDIDSIKVRHAVSGNLIIEVTGPNKEKADQLAGRLKQVLAGKATIVHPQKLGELIIRNMDDSTTVEEVKNEIALLGKAPKDQIKTGEIKTMRNGLGTIWVRCPLESAIRVAEEGIIRLGWTS